MIEFDCFYYSKKQKELTDIGLYPDLEDIGCRRVLFLSISSVSPYVIDGVNLTCIVSGGSDYIVNLSYDNVVSLIKEKW